ncbi:pilus assembly protein [Geomonas azotofigens]|uniref:pilus assembly protein n=1 Tax=Geomonas azotofigens TaxID=2843196 RepID=UPI001C0F738C|nr:hypothetical protein [Geomonas azotofigens]MBU5613301.1 hypothetical protein [Geomonas azotofigens]
MRLATKILSQCLFLMLLSPLASQSATLNDYCVVPPFIQEIAKPNLLMIIDNSASMYDLAYVDKGRKTCSGDTSYACDSDATCAAVGKGTCTHFLREPYYCYDQTFSSANSYVGYFDSTKYYQYDFDANQFSEVGSIPTSCAVAASSTSTGSVICKIRPGVLHVNMGKGDASGTHYFYASGKYLNWITASKFDVEKQVLTGGKYVAKVCSKDTNKSCLADGDCTVNGNTDTCVNASSFMQPESRGCVGRGFVKEALTNDFVNYTTDADNTNTSLQIAFTVQGPPNPVPTAPTPGGQTYISVFGGKDYDFGKCQAAIDAIATGTNATIKSTVADCLTSSAPTTGYCQQKTTQSCTTSSQCVQNSTYSTTTNVCSGATNLSCTSNANCSIPETKTCAKVPSQVCNLDSDCQISIPEKLGTCGSYSPGLSQGASNQYPTSCRTNANCSFSHGNTNYTGTCSGYVAAQAINNGPCQSTLAQNFGTCVSNYTGPCVLEDAATKTKVSFQQSMQACWQLREGHAIGSDDINTVINQCSDIYGNFYTCSNNTLQTCGGTNDTTTCGSGTCVGGPLAIGPGSPALLCGQGWEGQYYEKNSAGAWVLKAGYDKFSQAMLDTHTAFCNSLNTPVVTDPTDSPSDTSVSDNLPAILSGIGVEAQMGAPFATMRVRIAANTPPSGLVQEFENKIRIGLMTFNAVGSKTEVDNSLLPATKVCSNAPERTCATAADCGTGNSCNAVTDKDGAQVLSLVGKGHCKVTTGTACTKSAHCPTGEVCVSDGAGTHTSTGLVNSIDALRASTWTPFSEAFYDAIGYFAMSPSDTTGKSSRTDLRLNSDDFPSDMNPSEYVCQSNNILLVTDGASTADQNGDVGDVVNTYKGVSGNVTGTCPKYAGSKNLDDLAWLARHRNINAFSRTSASTEVPVKKNQMISTYVVFNGADNGESGECDNLSLLSNTASKGGTDLLRADIPDQYQETLRKAFEAVAGGTASGTAASILSNSEGSGANILQAVFYPSKDFETPTGQTTPTFARWIGEVQNLWYYVDPFIGNSTVREDTNTNNDLDIVNDYVVDFQFKGGETLAVLTKDTNGDGAGDTVVTTAMDSRVKNQGFCTNSTTPTSSSYSKCATDAGCITGETCVVQGVVNADDVHSLWRAGRTLWERNLDNSHRTLFTYLYGTTASGCTGAFSGSGLYDLAAAARNWDTINANDKCILKSVLQASSDDEAKNILKFAEGYDYKDYDSSTNSIPGTIDNKIPRKRTVQRNGLSKVWKLGDVITSTPRIQSFNKLNNYHLDVPAGYADTTYANDATQTGFANSTTYKERGMAYAGANDGMLHAFNLGSLTVSGTGPVKATLNDNGSTLGKEMWAFLPKHVLPYLKYLADPDYSHLYLVDGPTRLVDASIGTDYANATAPYVAAGCNSTDDKYWACKRDGATTNNKSWRTILIGSMGVGGASANAGATCTDCIKTPVDGVGYSSYYALDITNPANPTYLWEFSDANLGAATTGAAVVRIAHTFTASDGVYGKEGSTPTNGRWFAVIGNGPSGPIDTTYHQFKGKSNGPLRLFILDLKTGSAFDPIVTSINNAFAGAIGPGPIDTDRSKRTDPGFYSDDAVYFGYANCSGNCGTDTPTWDGGIMRLLTNESSDVSTWSLSTLVSGIGPVTTAVSKIQDRKNHNLWLYSGSGRYFFKGDDSSAAGKIFAVKEPCYDTVNDDIYKKNIIDGQSPKCTAAIAFSTSDFANQTSDINSVTGKKGWYIDLGAEDTTNKYGAERIITEPVAMGNGAVFFTSFMPSTDICNYGGNSYLWGMRYDTGGAASAGQLKGKALVQVSTGSFEEIDLSTALTSNLNRRMAVPMVGKPPTDPPPIVSSSGNKPLRRILHIQEK